MRRFKQVIWAFMVRDCQISASYRFNFILQFGSIGMTVFSIYFMSRLVGQHPSIAVYGNYLSWSVVGFSMASFFTTGFISFAKAIRNEQTFGTLESVLMTPAKISSIILASSVWNFIWTGLTAFFMLGIGVFFFHIQVHANFLPALLLLLATTAAFASMGVLSASFIIIFKRGDPVYFFLNASSFLLGGMVFPVSELPTWMQKISWILPITHGLTGIRDVLLRGMTLHEVLPRLLFLAVFLAIMLPFSLWCFDKAINYARREGSLVHY